MSCAANKLQLTLAILKPHIVAQSVALQEIRDTILTSNFKIVQSCRRKLTLESAGDFYAEHREKFFYNRLVTFMSSGPSDFYILARENAIAKWRELMGPTKVFKTQFEAPNTIRGKYGLSDTRNATHGSDSIESACREIQIFFPNFNEKDWYDSKEEHFRRNNLQFLPDDFKHVIQKS